MDDPHKTVEEIYDGHRGWTDVAQNIAGTVSIRVGDAAAAVAASRHVVEGRFAIHRHSGVPLETRGLVAEYDGSRLTVWGPTKVSHFNRLILAKLLNVDPSVIRFVEPAVGGGFGVRGEFYPEDYLLAFAAMALKGRRIAWQEDRLEHFVSVNHSREQVHVARLAVDEAGKIQALESSGSNSMGGYVRTHGATVATMSAIMLPGPYVVPNYASDITCVLENKTPTGTYRGPGRFECNFVRERLVDMAARAVAQDPADFRRNNFIAREQMPYDLGIDVRMGELHVHQRYDSGDYRRQLDEALTAADYDGLKRQRQHWCDDGRMVGLGLACFVEKSGIGAWEYARVEITPEENVLVFTGLESVGQGIETSLAQIAAEALQVDLDRVSVLHGDTDLVPRGLGAFASRGTMLGGGAVHRAALEAARLARRQAARLLDVSEASLAFDGTAFTAGSRHVTLGALAAAVGSTGVDGVGQRRGLCAEAVYESEELAYPYGVHLALVEVERETGILHILKYLIAYDVGVIVNPLLVRGQLVGGFVQGLGGAVLEEFAYSADGQPLFASFAEYMLPTAASVPPLEILVTENEPSTVHPLGVKGAGEGGTVAVAAALANAVSDAIGVDVFELPLSPPRLLKLIRQAQAAKG